MNKPHNQSIDLPLEQLIVNALQHLDNLGYSRRSLRRYRMIWMHLVAFSREHDLGELYDPALVERFIQAAHQPDVIPLNQCVSWQKHAAFCLRVLDDFASHGSIKRARADLQNVKVPPAMKKLLRDYERYAHDRLHLSSGALDNRIREVALFLDTLRQRNVRAYDQIQPADIAAFVTSRSHLSIRTVSRAVSDLRQFFKFLVQRKILQCDLSQALPTIRVPRDAAIPSVWDSDLVVRLLDVVDRTSPRGKRDYAILLLACRLGLRLGDIRSLTLDNLHWDDAVIEIKQGKTGSPLRLPLTDEVGEALIHYLKSGRPKTSYREIFLRARPPFQPFSENTHLYFIVTHWRQLAGIKFRSKQRQGLHSLRHTLATQLLQDNTPFHVISEILGHSSSTSTMIYAKANVEGLRGASLDIEGDSSC